MKKWFFEKLEAARDYIKSNPQKIARIAIGAALIGSGFAGIIWAIDRAVEWVKENTAVAVITGIVVVSGIGAYIKHRNKPPTEIISIQEREAAERTYVGIAPIMLALNNKAAQAFPIAHASREYDIHEKGRAHIVNGIWYFEYSSVKRDEVEVKHFHHFINREISRMMYAGEAYGGLERTIVEIGGVNYPALQVADVQDVGTHLLINLVFTSRGYLSSLRGYSPPGGNDNDDDFLS
jgi:hypothetical protein